jgi:hypothetical protein
MHTPLGMANCLEAFACLCPAAAVYELRLLLESYAVAFRKPQRILSIACDHVRTWLRELQLSIRLRRKAAITIIRHKHRWTSIEWQRK